MEGYLELISVPAIAVVVFAVMSVVKFAIGNGKFDRFVPLLSLLFGALCGVICFYSLPCIIPADNVVVALVIGGASGLTATGTHQMVKQLGNKNNEQTTDKSEENSSENTQDK